MKRRKKGINISKIKRNIKAIMLLLSTTLCLLYIIYITILSLYNYLYNRPIRTSVLFVVIGMLLMIYETIQDNKRRKNATQRNAYSNTQQNARQDK